ncbi:MAG: AraC family transcriptional regulator [Prolixibacteraceae bacterium]|nr:AraC family transcriptional regulator [Prolixibacteraceae bacterium]MBN2773683.1 AraC family transcriptional regulator [Prolixibacteraceae bacterium]
MDLWLTEIGEIRIEKGTIWNPGFLNDRNMLIYCTSGQGIIQISKEQIPVSDEQFIIIPQNNDIKYYSVIDRHSTLLIACFNGAKAEYFSSEFSVVRNLIPSVNNMVANREMLFDEIFNNLSKGFHDENMEYINFCFGHLLATFVFAHKTSEDLAYETNPVVRHAIDYLGKNLDKKLTLKQISEKVGYSPTYFTTVFRNVTGYSPISYFSHLKILKACEYLDYTNMKIKQISFELGYSDPYYFSRDFSKRLGLSPRNYRYRVNSRQNVT